MMNPMPDHALSSPPIAPPGPSALPAFAPVSRVDAHARNAAYALFGACVLLAIGLLARSWFSARGGVHVGLLGFEVCEGSHCESASWLDMPKAPSEMKMFVMFALVAGAAAIGFMIHAGVMLLRGQPQQVKLKPLNIALGLSMFGALSFLMRLMAGELSRGLSVSWAGILALAGLGTGIAIVRLVVTPRVASR